jgi:hypothetical protein
MSKRKEHLLGIKQGKLAEFCGWYGMLALIVAYFLVSFGWIDGQGLIFQIINLTGGVGLLIVAASKGVLQSVILNFFWAIIGVIAIARIFLS